MGGTYIICKISHSSAKLTFRKRLTGVTERLNLFFLEAEGSLVVLVGEPCLTEPLTMVFGVVVEFESDSFSKLPPSSLSTFVGTEGSLLDFIANSNSESRLNDGELKSESLFEDDSVVSGFSLLITSGGSAYCNVEGG